MAQDPQGKSPLAAYVPKPFQGIIGAAVIHDDHLIAHAAIETSLNLTEQASDIGGLVIDGITTESSSSVLLKGAVKVRRGACVREK